MEPEMDATLSSKTFRRFTRATSPAFPAVVAIILVAAPCGAALIYAPNAVLAAGYYFGLSVDSTPIAAAGATNRPPGLICAAASKDQAKPRVTAHCGPEI
jgi:hypothetical protein